MVLPELKIHELCAETYNGMIRLLKLGCRTMLLIVDRESKEKLVAKFYEHGLSPSLRCDYLSFVLISDSPTIARGVVTAVPTAATAAMRSCSICCANRSSCNQR